MSQRIVIIGATSLIAQHCARLWSLEDSAELILVGRNPEKLNEVSRDLMVRNPQSKVSVRVCNFLSVEEIQNLANELDKEGPVDVVLIAHGTLPDQTECQKSLSVAEEAMMINGLSPVYFAEAFSGVMETRDHGDVVIVSSVAGERGRQSNYVYGAAKGLVTRYAEGLQHRLANSGVNVILVKPGPTQTPMTAHMDGYEKMSSPSDVAKDIVEGIKRHKPVIYTPIKWAVIMFVISNIPRFVFNRMKI